MDKNVSIIFDELNKLKSLEEIGNLMKSLKIKESFIMITFNQGYLQLP